MRESRSSQQILWAHVGWTYAFSKMAAGAEKSKAASNGDQEGIPVSIMEAQACGLPVISTSHSGIPELVADAESGILAPERDAEGLASALLKMIERSQLWPSMGLAGRRIVEESFNVESLNDDLVEIYKEAQLKFRSASQI